MRNKPKVTAETKAGKCTLIPKLRFPEFRDAGAWEKKTINQICTINPSNDALPDNFFYIDLESVNDGKLTSRKKFKKDDAPSRAQRLLKNGDVIYQIVRPYQKNNLFFNFNDAATYVASTGYAQLRANGSKEFLYQLVHTDGFVSEVVEKCRGSNYPAVNSSDLAEIAVLTPKISEQQKIADCLSSVDALIDAQVQKVEVLKAHKKGLMQLLFPAEGETIPKLRFPEFQGAEGWETTPLKKISEINPSNGELPEKFIYIDLESVEDGKLISKKEIWRAGAPSRAQRLIKGGDVIYQVVRPYQKNNLFCDFKDKSTYVASTGYAQLRAYSSSRFLYHLIHTDTFVSSVIKKCTGSNYPAINSSDLSEIVTSIPRVEEQHKIADCLSSLDALITAQARKIEALKTHKKGLMQQLFPACNGVDK